MYTSDMVIDLQFIRELNTSHPSSPGRPNYVSAASGLVKVGERYFVVADDELHLATFDGDNPGHYLTLFEDRSLPVEAKGRKKLKPDLEALVYLTREKLEPFGGLLALPSGSHPNRTKAILLRFDRYNQTQTPEVVPLDLIYSRILEEFGDLNIEGAVVKESVLSLLQRGNGPTKRNAIINIDLEGLIKDFLMGRESMPERVVGFTEYNLGSISGVPLSFTDACFQSSHGIWFLAAAENLDSTYDDGECIGSALGLIRKDGQLQNIYRLNVRGKAEGLWIEAGTHSFFVVTDSDDVGQPSKMYKGSLPL
jgi:hypothetical protein